MKKRWLCLLICCLFILQMGPSPVEAAEKEVYFTAAGSSVLPLSDSTMPFWSGGFLYIPSSMFTDNVWKALNVSCIRTSRDKVILHSAGRSLIYERGKNYAKDSDGGLREPGALERNGVVFVAAFQVAEFFGLQYSNISVPHGHLVWIRKPDFGLSERYFADAATSNMESAYNAYRKEQEKKLQSEEAPADEAEEKPPLAAKRIRLCLKAGDNTGALLDELSRGRAAAAFFCSPAFLEKEGDLLRRMTVSGQSIGIYVEKKEGTPSIEEQIARGNRALEQATMGKTRLLFLEGASEEERKSVENAGYRVLRADLDRGDYALQSVANANSLLKRITGRKSELSVWLGEDVGESGLRALLSAVQRTESRCTALNEITA